MVGKKYSMNEIIIEVAAERARLDGNDPERERQFVNTVNDSQYQNAWKSVLKGLGIDYKKFQTLRGQNKGSRNKYQFTEEQKEFMIKAILMYKGYPMEIIRSSNYPETSEIVKDYSLKNLLDRSQKNLHTFNNNEKALAGVNALNNEIIYLMEGIQNLFVNQYGVSEDIDKMYMDYDYNRRMIEGIFTDSVIKTFQKINSFDDYNEGEIDIGPDAYIEWVRYADCRINEVLREIQIVRSLMQKSIQAEFMKEVEATYKEMTDEEIESLETERKFLDDIATDISFSCHNQMNNIQKYFDFHLDCKNIVYLVHECNNKKYQELTQKEKNVYLQILCYDYDIVQKMKKKEYDELENNIIELYEAVRKKIEEKQLFNNYKPRRTFQNKKKGKELLSEAINELEKFKASEKQRKEDFFEAVKKLNQK